MTRSRMVFVTSLIAVEEDLPGAIVGVPMDTTIKVAQPKISTQRLGAESKKRHSAIERQ